jgi:3-deoxy-7-phosphoheptulonate synthase
MIIVMKRCATQAQVDHIVDVVQQWGLTASVSKGADRTIIGVIGDDDIVRSKPLEGFPGVENVVPVMKPYKQASLEMRAERTEIVLPSINGEAPVVIGGNRIVMMAGPCAVEGHEQLIETAKIVKAAGARILRGGAFKPRTSPYAFQGMAEEGLKILAEARRVTGLPVITEVMAVSDIEMICEYADILQIGARNMQNFSLLKEVGKVRKPVMIKRGLANTMEELLTSAEYVMKEGNDQVILCERGIRTFEKMTRNTLDLSAVPVLKRESHLPVLVDPSHGTGHRDLVAPMTLAGIAAGADALMVEVHPNPEQAVSDGAQSLLPDQFVELMQRAQRVAEAVDRTF